MEETKELAISFEAVPGTIKKDALVELKKYVETTSKKYQEMVVTEENLKGSKDDLAMLRKSYKDLEAERIRVKKIWNEPYDLWEKDYKDAVMALNSAISNIDTQVKKFEENERKVRIDAVKALIWKEAADMSHDVKAFMKEYPQVFGRIYRKEYENKSFSENKRLTEIRDNLRNIMLDLGVIGSDQMLLALYADIGNLSEAQLAKREHEEKARRLKEALKARKVEDLAQEPEATALAPEAPKEEYRPKYTFEELTITRIDENHLSADELKKARLKRTFIGPKYKLLALMATAEAMGITMEKENN